MSTLIVDDDPIARQYLRRTVESLGHDCLTAEGGDQAWEAFKKYHPQVIISDLLMPGVDGIELCRRIRRDPDGGFPSFIMVTAMTDERHALEGMAAGADDYLTKPLNVNDLRRRLIAAARLNRMHRKLGEQQRELERLNSDLKRIARIDALTGLGNRLRLQEDLVKMNANIDRHHNSYGVGIIDVDGFKSYNDSFGHLEGDRALKAVAASIGSHIRTGDFAYRFGGDEFVCIFPQESLQGTQEALERIRKSVQQLAIPHPDNKPVRVISVSAGATLCTQAVQGRSERLMTAADQALYTAKHEGGNRVKTSAQSETSESPLE
ncbi:MAG: GGDEF domain-containing response regulator [Actinomycetota bacterium]